MERGAEKALGNTDHGTSYVLLRYVILLNFL